MKAYDICHMHSAGSNSSFRSYNERDDKPGGSNLICQGPGVKILRYIRPSDGRIKFTHLQTRLLNLREVITKVTYTIIRLEVMIYSHKMF